MLHAVTDTETMGLKTNAVIVSMGVTIFDDTKVDSFQTLLERGINIYFDRTVQQQAGRAIEPGTLDFWRKQGAMAERELNQPGVQPISAIAELDRYLSTFDLSRKHLKWFCRGPQFDIAKLEDLFAQFKLDAPWHYRKPRCSRSWLDAFGVDDDVRLQRPEGMIPHNSLHDAAFEAYMIQRVVNGVNIPRV